MNRCANGLKLISKADRIDQFGSENTSKEKIDIYHEAGEACRAIGNYDEAIKYFKLELHESQLANLHDDILYCYRFLGECYLDKNDFQTSEKYHLNFLSLAQDYTNDERIEQAFTCLANTYWLWLSYLQEDVLYNSESDQLPRNLCKRSLDAAKNSLLIIEKLEQQLEIDINGKRLMKIKDIEQKQQDLALRRVRSYINIANVMSENYIHDGKDNASLQSFSQYIKSAIELSKKYHLYEELARVHSSVSYFYLSIPNYQQYKKEIISTMEQAVHYAQLTKNTHEYLSCLYDIAQTLVSFDDYEEAKVYLLKIYQYKKSDDPIKDRAIQDLANVQRLLTGIEQRYENETDLRKKLSLAEKCADIFSHLDRNEQSKSYYLKQLKHAQELNLDEIQMATIYSSLGSIYQDLKQWQLSIDYFRREMSCRIGLGINADIEQGYSLCEIIKCEYRLKVDLDQRIRTFQRVLTITRSTNDPYLIRIAVALVVAMKSRDSDICLNDDLEEFMANVQPAITEENASEILRCSERTSNDATENQGDSKICSNEPRLHLACQEINDLKKVKQFLTEGDNINLPDCHGWTPLHKTVDHGHIDILRYLLDHRANINAKTNNGMSALIIACYHGHFDVIEMLLTYAARVDIRTNHGYTAVDYLADVDRNLSVDDRRKFHRLKQLLLAAIRKDEPLYCPQPIVQNDFNEGNNPTTLGTVSNRRPHHPRRKNKSSIVKPEPWDANEQQWLVDDFQSIECKRKSQIPSPLYTPITKRKCPMSDHDPSSNEMEIIPLDDADDLFLPFQLITPKSIGRSRQASTTSSVNTTTVLSPPTRIIRCLANTSTRTSEDKKLRIPISNSDTVTHLRYQVLKRLYDNFSIYACFVTLYDRQDWELGLSESDTIQFALLADESDIKAVYIEKNPIVVYERLCREMRLVVYSNIRLILKIFFDKFELSLQRLSLKVEQAIAILKVLETFMFIYSINLSENNLTDEIFEQLGRLTLDQLKSLNLSKNRLTSNGIQKLFERKLMNNLQTLDLSGNDEIDSLTVKFFQSRFPNLIVYH